MVEILKQGQYQPLDVVDEVLIIFAGTRGHLDKVPVKEVSTWEKEFLTFIHDQKSAIRDKIAQTKDLDDQTIAAINEAIAEFQKQFAGRKAKAATAARA
jgi:F-type H+-transporting ATPase subunit alpha